MLSSSLAFAQNGSIGIFSDAGASLCNLYDTGPALLTVYVFHVGAIGATASQFKVEWDPNTFTATKVGENYNFTLTLGSFQYGISFAYQTCLSGTFALGDISFFGSGTSQTCALIQVVPDPAAIPAGSIWTVDCTLPNGNLVAVNGGAIRVNPDPTCECTTPAQESSWGQIKALYN
jgi:hypothetical protein